MIKRVLDFGIVLLALSGIWNLGFGVWDEVEETDWYHRLR